MSENTQCNHCSLIAIKQRARKWGMKVTTLPGGIGINCFIHPKHIKADKLDENSKYFACSFMELTSHCVC